MNPAGQVVEGFQDVGGRAKHLRHGGEKLLAQRTRSLVELRRHRAGLAGGRVRFRSRAPFSNPKLLDDEVGPRDGLRSLVGFRCIALKAKAKKLSFDRRLADDDAERLERLGLARKARHDLLEGLSVGDVEHRPGVDAARRQGLHHLGRGFSSNPGPGQDQLELRHLLSQNHGVTARGVSKSFRKGAGALCSSGKGHIERRFDLFSVSRELQRVGRDRREGELGGS